MIKMAPQREGGTLSGYHPGHFSIDKHNFSAFTRDSTLFLRKENMKHCRGGVSSRRHKLLEADMPKEQELRALCLKPFIHLVCVDVAIVV